MLRWTTKYPYSMAIDISDTELVAVPLPQFYTPEQQVLDLQKASAAGQDYCLVLK